jgi:hypothetical protein
MHHLLGAVGAGVGEQAVTGLGHAEAPCGLADRATEAGERLGRRVPAEVVHRDVVALGDHQHVHRRERVDVAKGERVLVLVDALAGHFAAQDPGKDVAAVVSHAGGLLALTC